MPPKPLAGRDDALEDAASLTVASAEAQTLLASPAMADHIAAVLGQTSESPLDMDRFLTVHAVVGAAADRDWLTEVCLPRDGTGVLNLGVVRAYIRSLFEERDKVLAHAMRPAREQVRPEDITVEMVPLEVAAQVLYYGCYPEVREHFDIATEQTGEPLNRVMLGIFGKYRDELHDPDMTLVAEISPAEQYGVGGRRGTSSAGSMRQIGGRPLNAQGEFLRLCKCCQVEFQPPKGRPNPDFCNGTCGEFDHALQTWAWNAVRYAEQGMASAQKPDPYAFRIRPEGLGPALQFMGDRLEYWLQDAERRVQSTRGAA